VQKVQVEKNTSLETIRSKNEMAVSGDKKEERPESFRFRAVY